MPDGTTFMTAIGVSDLTVSVDGKALLDGLNLTLSSTGVTVLIGQNGAGKSVFLRALNGLIVPESGKVFLPARQALVFQKPVLLRRSVDANLAFVMRDAAARGALLKRVGLLDKARAPARNLSGGEQQRLALARALATAPDLLLLDEPTASLDPGSTLAIERILQESAAEGIKILLVTHDTAQARRLARDVAFLHRGRIIEHSDAETFFDRPETAAARAYLAGEIIL